MITIEISDYDENIDTKVSLRNVKRAFLYGRIKKYLKLSFNCTKYYIKSKVNKSVSLVCFFIKLLKKSTGKIWEQLLISENFFFNLI